LLFPLLCSGDRGAALRAALLAGVDTFVCLLEWAPEYRAELAAAHGALLAEQRRAAHACGDVAARVTCLWFPIDDFGTAGDGATVAFVAELARRLRTRESRCVYVHCYSGRGRTGTVAIPLLMALYPEAFPAAAAAAAVGTAAAGAGAGGEARARALVNAQKRAGRTGRTRGGHMPEDPAQIAQIAAGEMAYKRGGHKAKH
jgi:hypothetical protein